MPEAKAAETDTGGYPAPGAGPSGAGSSDAGSSGAGPSDAGPRRADAEPTVRLTRWDGPWPEDDPDANFKAEVALYGRLEPMDTIRNLAGALGIPEGAVVRYVLARWATGGSGGLLELGPTMVHRLWAPVEAAEQEGSDRARLEAYEQLRQMISWLRLPLVDGSGYPEAPEQPPAV